jgi:hypothetical protein
VPKTLGKHPSHVFFNLFPSDCSWSLLFFYCTQK